MRLPDEDCVDESEETFLAFFASKTVASIRAPDQYLYPAPFNVTSIRCARNSVKKN